MSERYLMRTLTTYHAVVIALVLAADNRETALPLHLVSLLPC